MNDHLAAAIEAGMAAAYGGNCCPDGFDCECEATQYEKREVTKIITASLPHLRAMIAEEIREEWLIHSMACGESPATTPEQTDRDRGLSLGLERAAKIAEGK